MVAGLGLELAGAGVDSLDHREHAEHLAHGAHDLLLAAREMGDLRVGEAHLLGGEERVVTHTREAHPAYGPSAATMSAMRERNHASMRVTSDRRSTDQPRRSASAT